MQALGRTAVRSHAVPMRNVQRVLLQQQMRSIRCLASSTTASTSRPTWDVRMLYDGECKLCMKEVNFLRGRDEGKGKIDFVDIASDDYSPEQNKGISYEQAMGRIHAITSDGRIVTDIEVFRLLYQAVGLGWVYAITENPTVEKMANNVYGFWAKYRTQVTGRDPLEAILEKRRKEREGKSATAGCAEDAEFCDVDPLVMAARARSQKQL